MLKKDVKTVFLSFTAVLIVTTASTFLYQKQLYAAEQMALKVEKEKQVQLLQEQRRLEFLAELEKAAVAKRKEDARGTQATTTPKKKVVRTTTADTQAQIAAQQEAAARQRQQELLAQEQRAKEQALQAQIAAQKEAARIAAAQAAAAAKQKTRRSRAS